MNIINAVTIGKLIAAHREGDEQKFKTYVDFIVKAYEEQENDRAARIIRSSYTGDYGEQGKVVLDGATEQTTYYETGWYEPDVLGSGGSYRGVTKATSEEEALQRLQKHSADYAHRITVYKKDGKTIKREIADVHFKDKSLKPMCIWQDNLNESEDHIRYSTNNLVSPPLGLIGETYISDESYTHKWLVAQGGTELLEKASVSIDVDVIYAYDNVDKVEKSSEDGEVHGVLINSTMYLRESEIKQVARLIKDEKLRNRVLTLMRSHRRIVSAPEKENRNIREVASAQMLGQG